MIYRSGFRAFGLVSTQFINARIFPLSSQCHDEAKQHSRQRRNRHRCWRVYGIPVTVDIRESRCWMKGVICNRSTRSFYVSNCFWHHHSNASYYWLVVITSSDRTSNASVKLLKNTNQVTQRKTKQQLERRVRKGFDTHCSQRPLGDHKFKLYHNDCVSKLQNLPVPQENNKARSRFWTI